MTKINESASAYPYGYLQKQGMQKENDFNLFEPKIKDTLPNFRLKKLPQISLEEKSAVLFG